MSNNVDLKKKRFNQIPYRIEVIENLLDNKILDSMVDFKNDTSSETVNNTSEDIRNLLSKKYIDFNKAIKDIGGKLLYIKSGSTVRFSEKGKNLKKIFHL